MLTRSVGIHHVHAALAGVRRSGHDADAVVVRSGIPPALLDDPSAAVSAEQFARLVRVVWTTLDDELFGLAHSRHRLGTFAMMGYATVGCAELGAALRRAARFYELLPPGVRFAVVAGGTVATLEFDGAGLVDPDRFVIRSFMAALHRFAGWLVGSRLPLVRAEFGFPAPPHAPEYELVFGCPPTFDAPRTALHLPARVLGLPVVRDETALREFLRSLPAEVLVRRNHVPSAAAQVRRVLARARPADLPDLERVAGLLDLTPPALRRRLHGEGTSFRAVRDGMLRDLALAHLARPDLSVADVSRRLGFSEPSAFHRAYRRWTGETPRGRRP